jgi:gentisate 1,2-dioxygenase
MSTDQLGKFPVEGPEGRKKPVQFYHIPREKMLRTIHGTEHPMPLTFYVSNDWMHVGEFVIPPGGEGVRASEPDVHKGDMALYAETGPIVVMFPDTGETFEVLDGETLYIPEGMKHQFLNYSSNVVKGIFAIAPEL